MELQGFRQKHNTAALIDSAGACWSTEAWGSRIKLLCFCSGEGWGGVGPRVSGLRTGI